MKEILALFVLSMVLAAPDWTAIEKIYEEISNEEKAYIEDVEIIANPETNDQPDAARSIIQSTKESVEKLEAFFKDKIKPEIDGKSLTVKKAEEFFNQRQQIREEYRNKMKPEIEKMADHIQESLNGITKREDDIRQNDKMERIYEALRA